MKSFTAPRNAIPNSEQLLLKVPSSGQDGKITKKWGLTLWNNGRFSYSTKGFNFWEGCCFIVIL